MQTMKTARVEGFDRHGTFGEPMSVYYTDMILTAEEETFKVMETTPDGRQIVDYEGTNLKEAETIFEMISGSSVPTS